jgi:hypothetical protein
MTPSSNEPAATPVAPKADAPKADIATASDPSPQPVEGAIAPMTTAQAEQILAELKSIKQNLLWVLLIGGFFAARALFFHY